MHRSPVSLHDNFHFFTISDCCTIVQFEIFLSRLKVSVFISISLTFQTLFAASFMNNSYKLMKASSSMMFQFQNVLFLPTPQKSVFFLPRLPFIMPQVTCLAQGACFVNVFELLTLGGVVLQDMIVFSFNMIMTNQVSAGCTLHGYATFFPFATTRPVSWYSTIGTTPCLMGIAGTTQIPHHLTFDRSLDAFQAFFVNKYIDHHAHEYVF